KDTAATRSTTASTISLLLNTGFPSFHCNRNGRRSERVKNLILAHGGSVSAGSGSSLYRIGQIDSARVTRHWDVGCSRSRSPRPQCKYSSPTLAFHHAKFHRH